MKAMDACLEPPLLVFGGPYSNLRALDALRQRASKLGIAADHCICTGDVVAYCTELAPCARSFAMRCNASYRSHPVQPLRRGDLPDAIATSSPRSPPRRRCRDVLIAIALAAKVLVPHPRVGS